jgi:hypothetical protein
MSLERAKAFTLHRIIFGDMVLNWVLSVLLLFVPDLLDNFIGNASVLPASAYRLIGAAFFGFALWQLWRIRLDRLQPVDLMFAALMAEIPVILLTAALLFWNAPTYTSVRAVLWIGNAYVLVLGAWYFALAWWMQKSIHQIV